MNCGEVRKVLHDYVDSNLKPEVESEVDRHLGSCETCEEHERKLRSLVDEASGLPEWIEPSRDLWPGIMRRLDDVERARPVPLPGHRPRVPMWGYGVLVASVLIAIVAGAYIGRGDKVLPGVADYDAPGPVIEQAHAGSGRDQGILEAEGELIQHKDELRQALQDRRDSLDPETIATVDRNLKLIEDAIAEIHVALEKEPTNPELNRMLMAAHRRELYLLQRAMQLAARL